jgi:ribosomal protein L29
MKLLNIFKSRAELEKEIVDLKKKIRELEAKLDQSDIDKLSLMSQVESLFNLISK